MCRAEGFANKLNATRLLSSWPVPIDPMLPAELLRQQIVARIPGSRLIFLDCGHEIRLEKPWEAAALIDITAIRKT